MATPQGDGSIILTTAIDQSGLKKGIGSIKSMAKTATKAFLAVGAASATATIAIAKASVDAFAEYEQLVGGVETLFKGSSKKLIAYANEAYRTTGQSANEYMQNVTAFSASLLSAVGGDTEKAADIANAAMISISDNVNKMGSSVESVQLAFQGFAKQQYQLLDNLKLGYGGTKGEMERLLKDAEAYRASMGETVDYEITNLADVYTAIGDIQEKLKIAGTTAKEASTTISGSAATMKASWQNVLTAISGGGDLDRAINNLVGSISNYFGNIVPVVERALSGIGKLIEKVTPMLVQTVARSLIKAIPSLLSAVYEMIIGLAKGIYQGIIDLFSGTSRDVLTEQADNIKQSVENQNDLTTAVEETNDELKKTTASFDTVEILSAGTAQEASAEPIIPEISGDGLGESLEIKETEKEMSGFEKALKKSFDKISKTIKKAWDSSPIKYFWENVILESLGGELSWQTIGERIKSITLYMWDSEPVKSFWGAVQSLASTGLSAFQIIGTSLWVNLKTTWGNIEGDFNTMTSNMSGLWTSFWQDVQIGIDTWGQPIIEGVNGVFNSIWTTAIDPYIQLMVGAWSDFTSILKSKWEEYGQPLVENIGQFVNNVIELFQSIYDNVLEPIITPFLETMSSLWDEHISVMTEKVVDFVMKLVNGALEIYNKFIHPIVMWLTETLEPIFIWIGNTISDIFDTIISTVSDVLGGIFDALGGLIDFIVGVFTGDWEQAWEGIKSFFVGIWDAIWAAIKGVINLIIDGLNALWGGLYGALASIVNGIGGIVEGIGDIIGADWGWEIPSNPPLIPKLAQGTVVPPNKEFMTILGDNTKEHEIVSPISTMKQAFTEAMIEMGGTGQTVKEEHYYLSETELMTILHKLVKGGERLQGNTLISSGGVY